MNTRNRRTSRSGVAVTEERTLSVVPESAEVQAARIIASLRDDTALAPRQRAATTAPASPLLRIVSSVKRHRQRAIG